MSAKIKAILIALLLGTKLFGQSIHGKILDDHTGEALSFANVYVNNSTIGTTTDANGEFGLDNVPLGSIELIASYVGYDTHKQSLQIKDKHQIDLSIRLVPSEELLGELEVVAEKNKEWDAIYVKFEKAFLGQTTNSRYCTIVNPWVVDVVKTDGGITASAKEPIEVENLALGYKIAFDLEEFSLTDTSYSILGYSFYSEMTPKKKSDPRRWERQRVQTYERSLQHLFLSILNKSAKKNGYELYKLLPSAAHLPRSDWFKVEDLGKRVAALDEGELNAKESGDLIFLELPPMMEIHFNRISTSNPVYKDIPFAVSWIVPGQGALAVSKNGSLVDPNSIAVYGYLSTLRVADLMPIDYVP